MKYAFNPRTTIRDCRIAISNRTLMRYEYLHLEANGDLTSDDDILFELPETEFTFQCENFQGYTIRATEGDVYRLILPKNLSVVDLISGIL
jgi:hypothetical protein